MQLVEEHETVKSQIARLSISLEQLKATLSDLQTKNSSLTDELISARTQYNQLEVDKISLTKEVALKECELENVSEV